MNSRLKIALIITVCTLSVPAQAANIILYDTNGSFAAAEQNGRNALFAFQKAANFYNRVLTDNIDIHISIGFSNLSQNRLAEADSSRSTVSVSEVYRNLKSDVTSLYDLAGNANLTNLNANGSIDFLTNFTFQNYPNLVTTKYHTLDNDNSINNRFLNVSNANAKSLGLTASSNYNCSQFAVIDSCITFNSGKNFDFDPLDGISSGATDFSAVALHELGHALGFLSGVDEYDEQARQSIDLGLNNKAVFSILDLFRFQKSQYFGPVKLSDPRIQLAAGVESYFVGGQRPEDTSRSDVLTAYFAKGVTLGLEDPFPSLPQFIVPGYQASHFQYTSTRFTNFFGQCDGQIGIMEPVQSQGCLGLITSNDLRAFDVIGYNLDSSILSDIYSNLGRTYSTADIFRLPGEARVGNITDLFGGFGNGFSSQGGAFSLNQLTAVPEPSTWATIIFGFAMVGSSLRSKAKERRSSSIKQFI
jgi:hypothetical protein